MIFFSILYMVGLIWGTEIIFYIKSNFDKGNSDLKNNLSEPCKVCSDMQIINKNRNKNQNTVRVRNKITTPRLMEEQLMICNDRGNDNLNFIVTLF